MAMNKTNFSKKCEIMGQIHLFYGDTDAEGWVDLFTYADVGFPLAYMVWTDVATVNEGKEFYIDEAWNMLCATVNVDPDGEYEDLTAFFAASPNPPLGSEDEDWED
jgi:hypothetical protein